MADLLQVALADNPVVLYDFRDQYGLAKDYANSKDLTLDGVDKGADSATYPGSKSSANFTRADTDYAYLAPNATVDNLFSDSSKVATVEAIVYMGSKPGHMGIVSKGNSYSSQPFWSLMLNNYTGSSYLPQTTVHRSSGFESNRPAALGGSYFAAGAWYMIQTVMFAVGTDNRWWIDGTSYANASISNGAGTYPDDSAWNLNVGADSAGATPALKNWLDGAIAYLAIYNYDIGDTAMQAHYDVAANGAEEPYGSSIYVPHMRRRRHI